MLKSISTYLAGSRRLVNMRIDINLYITDKSRLETILERNRLSEFFGQPIFNFLEERPGIKFILGLFLFQPYQEQTFLVGGHPSDQPNNPVIRQKNLLKR